MMKPSRSTTLTPWVAAAVSLAAMAILTEIFGEPSPGHIGFVAGMIHQLQTPPADPRVRVCQAPDERITGLVGEGDAAQLGRRQPANEGGDRVQAMAALLKIESFLKRRPPELSGGESQRVALGRALIREPAALLMDEPLSSLPPDLRFSGITGRAKVHVGRKPLATQWTRGLIRMLRMTVFF